MTWQFRARLGMAIAGPRLMVAIALAMLPGALAAVYSLGPTLVVSASLLLSGCGWLSGRRKLALVLLVVPALSWGYCLWRAPRPAENDLSVWVSKKEIIFRGEVSEVLPGASWQRLRCVVAGESLLFPRQARLSGRTLLTLTKPAGAPAPGDEIAVRARIASPEKASYPWQFDDARYLARKAIFSTAFARSSAVGIVRHKSRDKAKSLLENASENLDSWLAQSRARMVSAHCRYAGRPEGDLLASMVLGDRAVKLPGDLTDQFRDLGLSHILAASGFNLTLVTGVTWWLGRLVVRSVWGINLLCFASMLTFVLLAGPSPSVVRAALMCSLVLASRCASRSLYAPAALSLALILTLVADPGSIADVGLQLSYAATAGIICGVTPLCSWLDLTGGRFAPRWLTEPISVVLVAQASVLPIQLNCFWQMGLFFLPANLLVTPIVTVVTVLGFFSSMLVLLDQTGALSGAVVAVIDGAASYPLKFMIWVINHLAACDAAKLHLGPPAALALAFYYLCLIFLFLCLRARKLLVLAAVIFLTGIIGIVWRPALPRLTLASFPKTLIVINGRGEALCFGDATKGDPARFLAYSGVKKMESRAPSFLVRRIGSVSVVDIEGEPRRILIVDGSARIPSPGSEVPHASAVVVVPSPPDPSVTGSTAGQRRSAGLHSPATCPDPDAVLEIVRRSGAQWVVVQREAARFRHGPDRLDQLLDQIRGVHLVRPGRNACILVADDKDGTGQSFARASSSAGD